MKEADGKQLKLYLTSWQKRMVADFVGKKALGSLSPDRLSKILIRHKPGGCLASYKLPPEGIRENDWVLYLTDEQMLMVNEEFGLREHVSAVNISKQEIAAGNIQFA